MSPRRASVAWMGDTAVLVGARDPEAARRVAGELEADPVEGVAEVVVGYRSVTVFVPGGLTEAVVAELGARAAHPGAAGAAHRRTPRHHEIPVSFDGPDLEEVARQAGVGVEEVVAGLTRAELGVALVGFSPGFGYLVGMPRRLGRVARRQEPRTRVPAGSVAVAGGFAGVYPQATPGGWQLVGRTELEMFDLDRPPYSRLAPGDTVRLRTAGAGPRGEGASAAPDSTSRRERLRAGEGGRLVVEEPGVLTTVQDAGREMVAGIGVPPSGAADPVAARLANRGVGNPAGAALLEVTARGPTLRFDSPGFVAVVGGRPEEGTPCGSASLRLDGRQLPAGAVVPVLAGQCLEVGAVRGGLRAYLAISGGIETPVVLGSRSSDVLCGFGPGPLVAGDQLALGPPGQRPRGTVTARDRGQVPVPAGGRGLAVLRVLRGPHPLDGGGWNTLTGTTWVVAPDSDRVGVRLQPAGGGGSWTSSRGRPSPGPSAEIDPVAVVTGAVQWPPGGSPIVLGCDHATVGGYPVVAAVISADWGLAGQLVPGEPVVLREVDRPEAARARRAIEAAQAGLVAGWYPTRAG